MPFSSTELVFAIASTLLVSLGLLGCGAQDCTLLGCNDSLHINVRTASSTAVGTFTGTVTADGTSQRIACPSSRCDDGTFVLSGAPAFVRVEVATSSGVGSLELEPAYEENRPNGPNCSPVCKSGQLEVTVR